MGAVSAGKSRSQRAKGALAIFNRVGDTINCSLREAVQPLQSRDALINSLNPGGADRLQIAALTEQIEQSDGQDSHYRRRKHHGDVDGVLTLEKTQTHRQGVHTLVCCRYQGPQKHVPAEYHGQNAEGRHAAVGLGKADSKKNQQRTRAVHLGCLIQRKGDGEVLLPEKEGAEGGKNMRNDQRRIGVNPAQFRNDEVIGNQNHLGRYHQDGEHQKKQRRFQRELEPGKCECSH